MTVTEGYVRAGGLRLHDMSGGEGEPPLLLVHGLGSAGYLEWRFNLASLSSRHRVFAPDLPGFGRSDRPSSGYDVASTARVLGAYMAARGLERAVVVGASLGGRVALELAITQPARVARLVLVNSLGLGRPRIGLLYPMLAVPRLGEAVTGVARRVVRRLPDATLRRLSRRHGGPPPQSDTQYLRHLREMHSESGYHHAYLQTIRAFAGTALVAPEALARRLIAANVPVALIWGAEDSLFPLGHALRWHAMLPGSTLTVIAGAGHSPQADRPEEFNSAVESAAG